ncbi:MAG: His-Xaa-Ser system radical SAM maturase HxsB [Candidatus Eremiobacteraeota bacterium]|nr:His-Xaa-Ser system radical SAM maturase HxsB [Candidatus Eremiobacteraeota bacterium]
MSAAGTLTLLPFHFKKLGGDRVLLVNLNGEFTLIDEGQFSQLLEARRPGDLGSLYFPLKGRHFIADDDLDLAIELMAVKMRSKRAYMRDFTALHMVVITARCSCMCDYCQASSTDPASKGFDMTPEVAEKVVEVIFDSPSPGVKIEFQGGEPTLNWPIIELIVKKAEKLNRKKKKYLDFVVCSNLLHAEEKWAKFCREHRMAFSTSLDGPKELHDLHRRSRDNGSSYDRFVRNLAFYRRSINPQSCSALLTITRDNITRLREIIDHYLGMGFRSIFLRGLNPYGFAVKNRDHLGYPAREFVEAYRDALEYLIELNMKGTYFSELYAEFLLLRILTPFSTGFVDLQSPAGAGISGAVYDYNGEVYPADEGRMLARMGDKRFLMGNVLHQSHGEIFGGPLLRELVRESCVEMLPMCAQCVYQPYCGADPVRYYVERGDIRGRRPGSEFCTKNMGILDYLFGKLIENDERVMEVFWSWIQREGFRCVPDEGK